MQSRDTPVVTWLRDVDCCNVACTWCTMHDTDTITRKNVDHSVYCRLAGNCVYAAATSGIAVRMRRTTSGSDLRLPAARRCREINEPWRPDFNSHTLRAELRGTAAEIWERWNTTAIFLLSNDRTLCGRQQRYYRFTRTTLFTVRYSNKTKNNNMYNNKIYRYIAYATSLCSGTPRRITVTWNSIIKSEIGYQWHIAWRHLLYTETDYIGALEVTSSLPACVLSL